MVDYDLFLQWATERFGEENIKFKKGGSEICTHSFFVTPESGYDEPDQGYHLWMNPTGGKKELEHGVYRCWKTDEMGSLVSLVAMLDNIPFDEAEEYLCGCLSLRSLEQKVEDFFRSLGHTIEEEIPEPVQSELHLPEHTVLISKLPEGSFYRNFAEKYLRSRKLPIDGYYICTDGKYKNRIVIPYYDEQGKLIWFNARSIGKDSKMKYKKPEGEGLSQDNVLYFPDYPPKGSKVYLTEGEFDAMVLRLAGFYSCACGGKFLSPAQIQLLRGYKVVMAFDNDAEKGRDAGKEATLNIGDALLEEGFLPSYIRPPVGYKDWNELLEKRSLESVRNYIDRSENPYTEDVAVILRDKDL